MRMANGWLRKNTIFPILIIAVSACSAHRTTIIQPVQSPAVKSFFLNGIQLGKTFSDAGQVTTELAAIEDRARQSLSDRGYVSAPRQNADEIVSISIQTDVNDGTAADDLRFMKGALGSRFPSANPRVRDIESDHLNVSIVSGVDGHQIYLARCRLFPGIEQSKTPGILDTESIYECLQEVIEPLPRARP